jgi:hypothetical protein
MRPKAAHSMMQADPSTHAAADQPAPIAPSHRHAERQPAGPLLRRPTGRTSRPEPPASDQRPTHLACSGKQRHPTSRSLREQQPEAQTTDATDTKAPEPRSRGRSQALLFNAERPHEALGYQTPAAYAASFPAPGERLRNPDQLRRSPGAPPAHPRHSQPRTLAKAG